MFITQIYFSLRAKLEFKKFELKIGKFFQNQKEKEGLSKGLEKQTEATLEKDALQFEKNFRLK